MTEIPAYQPMLAGTRVYSVHEPEPVHTLAFAAP
jgi:hypothetical protein